MIKDLYKAYKLFTQKKGYKTCCSEAEFKVIFEFIFNIIPIWFKEE